MHQVVSTLHVSSLTLFMDRYWLWMAVLLFGYIGHSSPSAVYTMFQCSSLSFSWHLSECPFWENLDKWHTRFLNLWWYFSLILIPWDKLENYVLLFVHYCLKQNFMNALVQDCSISSALTMQVLQSYTKSSIWISIEKRSCVISYFSIIQHISC